MPIIAHAGHWTTSLIYLAPVIILAAILGFQSFREGRRADADEPPEGNA